jgi:hypothetical protein
VYAAGEIKAVAMDQSNQTVATYVVQTPGDPAKILLQIDAPSAITGTGAAVLLDGQDVALIRATIVDSNGVVVTMANNSVTFAVTSGPGRIVGSHNGDPANLENNHSPTHAAYHGLVRAIVMVTEDRASPAWHRARLLQIDRDGNRRTKIVAPGDELKGKDDFIVVTASSPGLPDVTISIPLSVDAAQDGVLAVASRPSSPVFD